MCKYLKYVLPVNGSLQSLLTMRYTVKHDYILLGNQMHTDCVSTVTESLSGDDVRGLSTNQTKANKISNELTNLVCLYVPCLIADPADN